ncbi:unnamed protein product [Schistosoma mattheei]|uniref:Uncharacterized protein n=1 Tax=Schistosoma mattheei TaxID=31246 RepID=A0A3P8EBW3_9TREM|nr:unnamed protein product [Schistosoma mattheei]
MTLVVSVLVVCLMLRVFSMPKCSSIICSHSFKRDRADLGFRFVINISLS